MRRVFVAFLLAAMILPLVGMSRADAQNVTAVISGPTAVAPSSTHPYTITVSGGPAAQLNNGTYQIDYVVQGDNTAGADPIIPRQLFRADGKFVVNITAPQAEGPAQLYVKATSSGGGTNETTETRLLITVAAPIDLRAIIRNFGAAVAINVTVDFYVDGKFVGNTTVARIEAGGQVQVNVTWIPVGLTDGQHTITIKADLDHDKKYDPDRGELVHDSFFYRSQRSIWPAVLGTVTVVVLVILVFVLLAIRRQRRQG